MQPVIVVTPGEPAGIGPDVVLALAQQDLPARVLCIADPALMRERASQLGYSIKIHSVENITTLQLHQRNHLAVFPVTLAAPAIAGTLNPANAPYVLRCLDAAVKFIQQGEAHALVTGPVHKSVINDAGIAFTGHTEYLAELTHATPVMMLASKVMRVALATTHLPLSQVSQAITFESLEEVIRLLHVDLIKKFGIAQPRILVCGLNPHAGEDGHLGREEIDIITPVLQKLRAQNMHLVGPLPADTLFTAKNLDQADAVLAMYHDQGLPVLKYSSFGEAVNITLGLPIIRTSVDHGTALELAGTGQANVGSMQTAFNLAVELAQKSYA